MKKIRITRKQASRLDWIFTIAYLLLAFWADWRLGVAFILHDVSRVFEDVFEGK